MMKSNRPILPFIALLSVCFPAAMKLAAEEIQWTERQDVIANPLKGWVVYGDSPATPDQPTYLFFSLRSWRQLEPREGQYDFESWESGVWNYWTKQGYKVIFRVYVDYPGRPTGMPQWLLDRGVTQTPYSDYGGGLSPDYSHPLFHKHIVRLIAALGARYNHDPRVAFLDVGILGHWGEWHTYPNTELFAPESIQQAVMQTFLTVFPQKKMMLRVPNSFSAAQPFGYRDDCFLSDTDGPEDWKFFNLLRTSGLENIWQSQPIGGEFCNGTQGALEGTRDRAEECLRLIREGHFSHLGPAGGSIAAQNSIHQAKLDNLLRVMGYRFVLRHADLPAIAISGQPINGTITLENTGVAPFYYPWPLQAVWLNSNGTAISSQDMLTDITQWLPGNHTIQFTSTVPHVAEPVSLQFALRIADPSQQGPPIRFENIGTEFEGAFVLREISIKTNDAPISEWATHR